MKPDYVKIFNDLIESKYPEKKVLLKYLKSKSTMTALEVIEFNDLITFNQSLSNKHKSYDEKSIKRILQYQEDYKLNNSEVSNYFKISRNSLTQWKRLKLN